MEQQLMTATMTVEQLDERVRNMLALMTPTAEAAKAAQAAATLNSDNIKALTVQSERLLKAQDIVSNKVSSLETQVAGLGTRITSLEGVISASVNPSLSPDGRREDIPHQGTALEHTLGNGAFRLARNQHESGPSQIRTEFHDDSMLVRQERMGRDNHKEFRMPRTNFPKFDGLNPKIWKEKAEKYFHMFQIPEEYKVDYATLHFISTAALWLQTYEAQHDIESWVQLCVAVCQKFGKDVYYTNMTKTLEIRQTSDVATYHQEFELLMHQLLTHNAALDDTFFVTKFLKGLKKEIRSAIILHKPRTVDAAISLALLQEAQLNDYRRPRYEPKKWHNQAGPGILPTPTEIRGPEGQGKQQEQKSQPTKLAELKAQHRARGECFKCGGKYGPGHKCPQ
jgi:hypothetical protein